MKKKYDDKDKRWNKGYKQWRMMRNDGKTIKKINNNNEEDESIC